MSLKDSYKHLFESNFVNKIRVGDILLVKNPAKNRQHWCLGRVLALYPGKDGKVRSVKLVRGDADYLKGSGGLKPELHSVQHLYPLELSITHPHTPALPDTPDVDSLIEKEVEPDLDFSHDPATPLDMSNIEEMSDLVDNTSKEVDVEEDCPELELEDVAELQQEKTQHAVPSATQPVLQELQDSVPLHPPASRRARRVVPSRRIMDDQFVFYE